MKLRFFLSLMGLLLVIGICGWWFFRDTQKATDDVVPEIMGIAPNHVTLAWYEDKPRLGKVSYWPLGQEQQVAQVTDPAGRTRVHEVRLTGLKPGTAYSYQLHDKGGVFQVETPPVTAKSFRALLFRTAPERGIGQLYVSETPAFLMLLDDYKVGESDALRNMRAMLPVYDRYGLVTAQRDKVMGVLPEKAGNTMALEWGTLSVVHSCDATMLQQRLASIGEGRTLGIITDRKTLEVLDFSVLARYKAWSSTPPCFVLVTDMEKVTQRQGVTCAGLGVEETRWRLQVDPPAVVLKGLDEARETLLRAAPVDAQRTCSECRQLADQGAYEKSVAAYKTFIEHNQDSYLVDDAYFAVANILDEKLFEFAAAIRWYEKLLAAYPESSLAPLGRQRLSYLKGFESRYYDELGLFERIRRVRYNRQKENPEKRQALLDQVRELAVDIQAPNLAADMLYWLANQVRVFDKGKAVKIYRRLINQYPESDAAPDARYAVCETFYDAGLYGEALGAYRELLSVLPDRKVTIQSQIQRCKRNIRRKHLAFGGWLLLGTLVGTTLLAAKQGVNSCGWRVGLWSGMLLLGVLGFGAWTIREQFINSTILICFVVGLSVLGGVAYPMSKTLRDWIGQWRSAKRYHLGAVLMESFAGIACGVFVVVSGVYVLIYHVYPHYLIVFKL